VFNTLGQATEVKHNNSQIDVSSLATGLYFIKITTANGVAVRQFIKE